MSKSRWINQRFTKANKSRKQYNKPYDTTPPTSQKPKGFFRKLGFLLADSRFHNGIMALATIFIAFFTIKQFFVTDRQANIMSLQSQIMAHQDTLDSMQTALMGAQTALLDSQRVNMSRQLEAMRLQAKVMLDASHTDSRPFIVADTIRVDSIYADSITYTLCLKNAGRTPACAPNVCIVEGARPFVFTSEPNCWDSAGYEQQRMQTLAIPPGAPFCLGDGKMVFRLNPARKNALRSKTADIFLYVSILYTDIFEEEHLTVICVFYDPKTKKMETSSKYNYAT